MHAFLVIMSQSSSSKKLILLTGGNSGIGLEACKILCSEGHKVVATVRSTEKGEYCLRKVKRYFPGADIQYMICDTSDPSSIRGFVDEFRSKHLSQSTHLNVLVNNAGMFPADSEERTMCSHHPNWEISVATNCFGPILLADLLKEDIKKAAEAGDEDAMILMVGSSAINFDKFSPYQTAVDDIMMDKAYKKGTNMAYKNSKVCLTLASLGLANELEESGVAVHLMCPGVIPGTNLSRNTSDSQRRSFKIFSTLCCCLFKPKSVSQGGQYIVNIATHGVGQGTNGKFWIRDKETAYPPQCQDKSKYAKMLEICRTETA